MINDEVLATNGDINIIESHSTRPVLVVLDIESQSPLKTPLSGHVTPYQLHERDSIRHFIGISVRWSVCTANTSQKFI